MKAADSAVNRPNDGCAALGQVPPLILLQFRSVVQLALSCAAVALVAPRPPPARTAPDLNPMRPAEPRCHWLGPRPLWGYIGLRSLLYWCFISCWWLALTCLPVGDATCVVYLSPAFSGGRRGPRRRFHAARCIPSITLHAE
jgi:drug/metabolite transporter (DMT)-like permease